MNSFNDWKGGHFKIIQEFLGFLNENSEEFILKGGTALLICYELDRFSEDIDLDAISKRNIGKIIEEFCKIKSYSYRIVKDTDTTKRVIITYDKTGRSLKIEVSYRRNNIKCNEYKRINGVLVYNINELCLMKASAYTGRDKIRDLYDICFICNNYWESLSEDVKSFIRIAVEYKGLEQFEYIIKDQKDELINNEELEKAFWEMYDKLGLLSE